MKVALLQINPTPGDVEGNGAALRAAMARAGRQGAELCVTSELALTGYPPRDLLLYDAVVEAAEKETRDLAGLTASGPALVLGAVGRNPSGEGKPLRNEAWFLAGGGVRARYAKQLLPTYDVFDETRYFEPGREPAVVEWGGLRLALTICEDIWNDSAWWNTRRYSVDPVEGLMSRGGFDALLNLSASPFTRGKQLVRQEMLAALARRTGAAVVYVNQTGGDDELIFDGRSMVVASSGELAARASGFAEDVAVVDLLAGGAVVSGSPLAGDDFCPESEIWRALVMGTRDFLRRAGMADAVVGLSGGVDSALVAAIACEALGADHVIGVLMPSPYSSGHSLTDAHDLARNLGMKTRVIPIEPAMKAFAAMLEPALAGPEGGLPGIVEENLQARIRGNILMAFSNRLGAMVLTTGNKSELSVGYCTLYGDMCGGLAVIGDLPKTGVYRVCRWLNAERGTVIPGNVLVKAPSAELRPGQTDQDSLPPYDELDAILEAMLEGRRSMTDMTAMGRDPAALRLTAGLVARSEFKRHQAAPVLKITEHAFGAGRRMPIACKPAYAR